MQEKIIANFTTITEQIEILKKRHLIFYDETFAKDTLQIYGYYNLINGYKEPYVYLNDGMEFYKDGTSFEQIYSLFCLDSKLRYSILTSMLALEEHLRAVTSYVIGEHYGSDDQKYLQKQNYKDRYVSRKEFSLDSILATMNDALHSQREPIAYHRKKYHNVPPWILVKGIYMNTLVNFIKFQKKDAKEEIIQLAYGIIPEAASLNSIKELFINTLFVCLDYRNMAAHGGRTYNFSPHTKLRINNTFISELSTVVSDASDLQETCNINQLLFLLQLFRNKLLSINLLNTLNEEVNRHCHSYPNDIIHIQQMTGLTIDRIPR